MASSFGIVYYYVSGNVTALILESVLLVTIVTGLVLFLVQRKERNRVIQNSKLQLRNNNNISQKTPL